MLYQNALKIINKFSKMHFKMFRYIIMKLKFNTHMTYLTQFY